MPVSSQTSSVSYSGDGSTAIFPVPFYFLADSHLKVVLLSVDGVETVLTLNSNYTVTGAGNLAGGSVTVPSEPQVGETLTILRNVPATQETDYVENDPFPAESHERALDKLTMLAQQQVYSISRAIRVPDSDPEPVRLPAAAARANTLLGFDGLGQPTLAGPTSGSSAELALLLADNTNPALGAALVGYRNRTVYDRLGDMLTIKDFRQIGFGIPGFGVQADDEAAFDAAIAAMNSGAITGLRVTGGLYVLNKTYAITRNGAALIGDGVDNTIIRRTSGTFGDSFVFARSDPATLQLAGISISGMTFHCQADMSAGGVLRFRNCTRVFMRDVFVRNCFKGIWLEGIRDSRFTDFEVIQGEHYTVDRTGAYHIHFDAPANPALKSTETFFSNFNMTTAGNAGDVNACIRIDGAVDGAWFNNAHWFGGKTAGVIISGDGVPDISNLLFTACFFDQFTARNIIIQGTTTDAAKFRLINFVGCKIYGGETNNIAIDSASGVKSVRFKACDIGQTLGQGVQIGAGQVSFDGCTFAAINQSAAVGGYALQTPGTAAAGTILTVKGCEFECSNLTYGIMCNDTAQTYHLHDCSFRGQGGSFSRHILFTGQLLNGTCGGHRTALTTAGDVAVATTLQLPDLAIDSWNITGGAGTVNLIYPFWHGARRTFKADTAAQAMTQSTGVGSIRNRAGAATTTIAISDVYMYEYRVGSNRWHQLG